MEGQLYRDIKSQCVLQYCQIIELNKPCKERPVPKNKRRQGSAAQQQGKSW